MIFLEEVALWSIILKVHIIPPVPSKRDKRVGIYCRVSTNSSEQLKSLTTQVSHLTRITAATLQWLLVNVYMDIATSKTSSSRKEFTRMLNDCGSNKLEIFLRTLIQCPVNGSVENGFKTKAFSRFGCSAESLFYASM